MRQVGVGHLPVGVMDPILHGKSGEMRQSHVITSSVLVCPPGPKIQLKQPVSLPGPTRAALAGHPHRLGAITHYTCPGEPQTLLRLEGIRDGDANDTLSECLPLFFLNQSELGLKNPSVLEVRGRVRKVLKERVRPAIDLDDTGYVAIAYCNVAHIFEIHSRNIYTNIRCPGGPPT